MNRLAPFLDSPAAAAPGPDEFGCTLLPAGVLRTITRDKWRSLFALPGLWVVTDVATGVVHRASAVRIKGPSSLSSLPGDDHLTVAALELRD